MDLRGKGVSKAWSYLESNAIILARLLDQGLCEGSRKDSCELGFSIRFLGNPGIRSRVPGAGFG